MRPVASIKGLAGWFTFRSPCRAMNEIMFEGQFKKTDTDETREPAVLRRFRWTDLVARLAATRELRDEIARDESGFGAFADARRESDEQSEGDFNHDVSAPGKKLGLKLRNAQHKPARGKRESE